VLYLRYVVGRDEMKGERFQQSRTLCACVWRIAITRSANVEFSVFFQSRYEPSNRTFSVSENDIV
jgi:hypothetical protein